MSEAAAMIEFMRARLDEDETRALKAQDEWDAESVTYEWEDLPDEVFAHARWHDPARVLREVEAKRAILAAHEGLLAEWDGLPTYVQEHCQRELEALERAVRHLAGVYRDHPGYRPDW